MENDMVCQMQGTGTILIQMYDGMIRELHDVSSGSYEKHNPIGALVSEGLRMTVEKDFLMITKESIIMKGVQIRNLYYLVGSTVIGTQEPLVDRQYQIMTLEPRTYHQGFLTSVV